MFDKSDQTADKYELIRRRMNMDTAVQNFLEIHFGGRQASVSSFLIDVVEWEWRLVVGILSSYRLIPFN